MEIIAEVGSNWATLEDCIHSIAQAARCGADVVKFQLFTAEALYGFRPSGWDRGLELRVEWLPILKEAADAEGIEFACTAFSPALVAAVDPFVKRHKIASSDCLWPPMLKAVADCRKPVWLSVGATFPYEVNEALTYFDADQVTLMYCEAAYPARYVDMRKVGMMWERYKRPIGFSDHTIDVIQAPEAAYQAGAVVLEKHFTALPDLDSPDRPHSLGPYDFTMMVDHLRGRRQTTLEPAPSEHDMRVWHRRGPDGFRRVKP